MEKPTKAQRHAIYKRALRIFDRADKSLCFCISKAMRGRLHVYTRKDWFPELSAQKPKNADPDGYWWSITQRGNAARRRALLRCIELSAPKPRK